MSCRLPAVYAHIEALDCFVLISTFESHLIKKQIDRAPLGVV